MSQTRLGCWQRLEFRTVPRRTPLAPTPLLSCCTDGGGPVGGAAEWCDVNLIYLPEDRIHANYKPNNSPLQHI
jgi:hypothetical protein